MLHLKIAILSLVCQSLAGLAWPSLWKTACGTAVACGTDWKWLQLSLARLKHKLYQTKLAVLLMACILFLHSDIKLSTCRDQLFSSCPNCLGAFRSLANLFLDLLFICWYLEFRVHHRSIETSFSNRVKGVQDDVEHDPRDFTWQEREDSQIKWQDDNSVLTHKSSDKNCWHAFVQGSCSWPLASIAKLIMNTTSMQSAYAPLASQLLIPRSFSSQLSKYMGRRKVLGEQDI